MFDNGRLHNPTFLPLICLDIQADSSFIKTSLFDRGVVGGVSGLVLSDLTYSFSMDGFACPSSSRTSQGLPKRGTERVQPAGKQTGRRCKTRVYRSRKRYECKAVGSSMVREHRFGNRPIVPQIFSSSFSYMSQTRSSGEEKLGVGWIKASISMSVMQRLMSLTCSSSIEGLSASQRKRLSWDLKCAGWS